MHTRTEELIHKLYRSWSITHPDQLKIKNISVKMKLTIYYGDISFRYGPYIIIRKSTKEQEWQLFGHEVGHYLKHCGSQLDMHYLFRELQEYQANYFAYHFCVPTFMLDQLKEVTVYDIMKLFNVEHDFATRRLEMYKNKLLLSEGVL